MTSLSGPSSAGGGYTSLGMMVLSATMEATMKPKPAEEVGSSRPSQTEADEDNLPPHQTPEPEREDDGSVPDKQIARWKNDGGSWRPAD